ncbi:MAG: aminotransferase class I/II-fold pyridoxal phosphate-dependent enzyme, partial [Candidatus Krumholzibacteriota bacterium]|nr:aminotransferase class I/II-fold pyridoxal phosphate-dependent enzyme [Candidatus Krumholzibacteriota bacterium]
ELRSAIAEYYARKCRVELSPSRVLVTMGVSPALLLVLSVLLEDPDGEIILGNPCYPCYPNFIRYLGGTPRFIPSREKDGFQLKPRDVEKAINGKTRAVIVNSPANPMGTLMPGEDLEAICNLSPPVISDEIYHGLVYGTAARSALEFSDRCYVLNGFSKLYAMTGWRLGYIIMPENGMRKLQILQQNFFISPNSFVQQAGIIALREDHPEVDEMIARYDERRRYLLNELPRIGLPLAVEPRGAFYFFTDARHIDSDSLKLTFDILDQTGVALTPGIDFGEGGEGYLRISYANSLPRIKEAMGRLEGYFRQRGAL